MHQQYRQVKAVITQHANPRKTRPCPFHEDMTCYTNKRNETEDPALFVPPYRAMVSTSLNPEQYGRLSMLFQKPPDRLDETFIPIADILDGERLWRTWERAARENEVWLLTEPASDEPDYSNVYYGIMFAYGFLTKKTDVTNIINGCSVEKDKLGTRPTGFCVPLAVVSKGAKWILADWRDNSAGGNTTIPDFTVDIQYTRQVPRETITRQLQADLERMPWSLLVRNRTHSLNGNAAPRRSLLIPPWREELNVDLMFDGWPQIRSIDVSVNPVVNRLATDRARDWHKVTGPEMTAYTRALRKTIKEAFDNACGSASWLDAKHLRCGH
ncbi:hypothetical protein C9I28_13310 [Pseudoduganella armeniaca]|uniref:Uncharacterized protein n=1 Tax=Pseudoduganella armeniaca TaxID=2072590 RepID=A0A2R4CAB1_9BURK|nr:hypothetical protein C9I28_13310 [Pseudoduganella armeniaca]